PTAEWRIRSWPGPGSPSSASSHLMTSGPPTEWMRIAFVVAMGRVLVRSAEMGAQEGGAAVVGELGRRRIVVLAADTGEGVVDAGIDMHGRGRDARQGLLDLLLRLRRHELVLLGEVAEIRLGDRRRLADRRLDGDAVIADIGVGFGARRPQ